jgi:Protein of unknown function (DUF1592)/Protein of unknown function (DUF1588)/Protein of unknown function (DUF1587)/Protein of unknown function (DUF1595)/Protein of unknown function (DUF1585)
MVRSLARMKLSVALLLAVSACTGQITQGAGGTGASTGTATGAGTGAGTGLGTGLGTGVGGNGTATGTGTGTAGASGGALPGTDPGRVTLRRLNRVEYNNTVRDLLGTTTKPADAFPPDDRGLGFDNIADVLTVSPVHVQLYQSTAETLITAALAGTQRVRILTCDLVAGGETCARTVLRAFGRRAWRRPVTDTEVNGLMVPVMLARTNGDSWEVGVSLALQAVLISPNFMFRVELDPTPTSLTPHLLTSHEIASRLSYFLWSTMPDDALFAAADAGTLTDKAQLQTQVTRMLKDTKAKALVDNFGGQWLYTRQVDEVLPDTKMFPTFDAPLRDAMKQETYLMLQDVIFNGVPADKLLLADYTYANDRLAKHYGLPVITGAAMQKVTLPATAHRGGFLTQGSFLTVTSHPTSTSPVLRGKWILEQLMCKGVAPPPNNVQTKLDESTVGMQSLRQRLEKHRQNTCAVCHVVMDPLGFSLENYDPIGAYRTMDGTFPVDASGILPDGRMFSGPVELANIVASDAGFANCVTEKLYTYALGRAPQGTLNHMDPALLEGYAANFRATGYPVASLVASIVTGDTFIKRRGEGVAP